MRDIEDKINFNSAKVQEFDRVMPILVKDAVMREVKHYFTELDERKLDKNEFT
jgi:hypothetical protein